MRLTCKAGYPALIFAILIIVVMALTILNCRCNQVKLDCSYDLVMVVGDLFHGFFSIYFAILLLCVLQQALKEENNYQSRYTLSKVEFGRAKSRNSDP
jgi:hypothetical protein